MSADMNEQQEPDTACNDTGQNDSEEQGTTDQKEKRYRRKSVRRQLQDVVTKLGRAADDPQQKSAKRVDALLRQSEVLMKLQEMDAEDRDQTLQDEHAQLQTQHAADAARIAELEAQNAELRRDAGKVETVRVPDPDHEKIRKESETLSASLKFLAEVVSNKEQAAVRAIQQLPAEAASIVCDSLGIKEREYRQYLQTYRSERDLLNVIEKAQVDDTPLLRFCRAVLAVNHSVNLAAPKTKSAENIERQSGDIEMLTGEEKLRRAKLVTGTLTPVEAVIGDFRPCVRQ